jgi:hypothetical protein
MKSAKFNDSGTEMSRESGGGCHTLVVPEHVNNTCEELQLRNGRVQPITFEFSAMIVFFREFEEVWERFRDALRELSGMLKIK